MKINGREIEFTEHTPQEEGKYLWQNSTGVEIITIYYIPPRQEYGVSWDGYYAVTEYRGRNVKALAGQFIKITDI